MKLHLIALRVPSSVNSNADVITSSTTSAESTRQVRRYEPLCAQARAVSSTADLAHLARALLAAQPPLRPARRAFLPPYPPEPDDPPMDVVQVN
ncbi:hypothetical protein EVAR_11421_1 [Eumeta japonica]|uniref:Uncharacterized protein n=1 Tax=Eumeta variegata TaxID=151549 RepID=A0A4C1TKL0_EUMVA|nr:hypothetical protein EVAR_11421_1 [Eumeta japonica]